MSERFHRTQLLLRPDQHEALLEIARREGQSISQIVRRMISDQLDRRRQAADTELRKQLEVLGQIRRHREAILARREGVPLEIDVVDLIVQAREEQDERNVGGLIDRRG